MCTWLELSSLKQSDIIFPIVFVNLQWLDMYALKTFALCNLHIAFKLFNINNKPRKGLPGLKKIIWVIEVLRRTVVCD